MLHGGTKRDAGVTFYQMRSIVDFTENDRHKVVKYWLDRNEHYDFSSQSTLHVNQFYKISEVITDDSGFKLLQMAKS